jgi:hypothetical protein
LPGNHFNVDGNSRVPRRERMPRSGRSQLGNGVPPSRRGDRPLVERPMPWRDLVLLRCIAAIDATAGGKAAELRSRLDEPAICRPYKLGPKSDSYPYAAILICISRGRHTARNHSNDKQNHARYGGSTAHGLLGCVGCWRVKHHAARAHGLNSSTGPRVCAAKVGRAARRISLSRRTEVERYARNRVRAACDLIPQI